MKLKSMKVIMVFGYLLFQVNFHFDEKTINISQIFQLDPEERLMHLNQLADCLLLFKRTMGSIEALQKEDVRFY